jgi:uncharacterized protein (TIGR02646 family)
MRPVSKGNTPKDNNGVEIEFKKYSKARHYLINRIGEYCSYCERKIPVNLAIEHIQPKSFHEDLKLEWRNFLLGCANCNSTKGDTDISLDDFVWPDTGNSYELFEYSSDGLVKPANGISDYLQRKARNMINLVGLDKPTPSNGTSEWDENSDRRQHHRIQALIESENYRKKYYLASPEIRNMMKEMLSTIVTHQGFWSIWMHAFETFPEVQKEFIASYVGTNKAYFQRILN